MSRLSFIIREDHQFIQLKTPFVIFKIHHFPTLRSPFSKKEILRQQLNETGKKPKRKWKKKKRKTKGK